MEPILKVSHLSKHFGTLVAVKDVSFEVYAGEVVGLVGWSDAGKSVIAMLLAGVDAADTGEILFAGQSLRGPYSAQALGIRMIPQHPELIERLDITEVIFLGSELCWPSGGAWLSIPNRRRMDREASRILDELGLPVTSLREKVANLSGEQRQMLSIAQAMARPYSLIIADEPTGLLGYPNQETFLRLIQSWRQQNVAVIFGTKDIEHAFAVTDRIVVLRQGRCVATRRTDETTRDEVVADLLGAASRQQIAPTLWALDSFYHAREQTEKLRHQQQLLQQDLAAQDTLNQQLIEQLARQISALDQANIVLQDAQRRLLTEREQERKHLARELHDQVIQDLLSLNYELEDVGAVVATTSVQHAELVDICEGVRALVSDLRRICGDLRPPTFDSLGLGAALESYARSWSERLGIAIELDLDPNLGRLPEPTELSVFRIVQEGLNNVRKHAKASAVQVRLKHTTPRTLMILIADNGCGLPSGFDLSTVATQGHYGLLGVSERVALLGGRLKLENQPQGGLLLQAEIPHPRVKDVALDSSFG